MNKIHEKELEYRRVKLAELWKEEEKEKQNRRRKLEKIKEELPIIPNEIILLEILSRLPIKSLRRFRCVSKLWLLWLSDTNFRFLNHQTRRRLIVGVTDDPRTNCDSIKSIALDDDYIDSKSSVENLNKPQLKAEINSGLFGILGSCNGMLLVSLGKHILCWNPFTRECKKVLRFVDLAHGRGIVVSGFCYDSATSDYNVIIGINISCYDKYSDYFSPDVYVTNFESRCWKQVSFPYSIPLYNWGRGDLVRALPGHLVNGVLHWLVAKGIKRCNEIFEDRIVYFDAAREEFGEVPIPRPKYVSHGQELVLGIGQLKGCLAMTWWDNAFNTKGYVDVWVMKEYGVEETWTILFKIQNVDGFRSLDIEPLCITKDGEVLLMVDKRKIVAYSSTGELDRRILEEINCITSVFMHVDSLISPGDAIKTKRRRRRNRRNSRSGNTKETGEH